MDKPERSLISVHLPDELLKLGHLVSGEAYKLIIKAEDQKLIVKNNESVTKELRFFKDLIVFLCSEKLIFTPPVFNLLKSEGDNLSQEEVIFTTLVGEVKDAVVIEFFCDVCALPEMELLCVANFYAGKTL